MMNEVRREPMTVAEFEGLIRLLQEKLAIEYWPGVTNLKLSYRDMAARVQALERERDVMSNSREALVEVVRELRHQLAEAQGRVRELEEIVQQKARPKSVHSCDIPGCPSCANPGYQEEP